VSQPLWTPSPERIEQTNVTSLINKINADWDVSLTNSEHLHQFSVTEMEKFWRSLIEYAELNGETWTGPELVDRNKLPGAKWFPEARFNYAENILKRRDDADAFVFWGENKVKRRMSFKTLYDQVSSISQALKGMGVGPGDKVAGYLPNLPETIIATLAAASLGAAWSSCSPDFGAQGVLDRFSQIKPKVVFCANGYHYNGKTHDSLGKVEEIVIQLPSVEHVVVIEYLDGAPDLSGLKNAQHWGDVIANHAPNEIEFAQLPFDQPLYIMFSSGTTGAPKCIIHSAGGSLLKHASEHLLHCNMKRDDRIFFFSTCGWMMWNWLVSSLAWGATVLLYDGSPFYPSPNILFDYVDAENMTLFGTSAKFIDALSKNGVRPMDTHDLGSVKIMCSTGSTLAPEGFDYVYGAIKKNVHLVSFTGGTDIMGCFMSGDPTKPVWRGELQQAVYGMDVDVFDDNGKSIQGEKGELVCKQPFPTVPLGFLGDPDGSRYHDAYFAVYDNIWCQGDFVEHTEHGGYIMFGRSDATLNPGGVRIGTAEIYRQVERLDEVKESIVIGQSWDNDVRVVLFVVLSAELTLDDKLTKKIQNQVRANCTPRHVPAKILQVEDIPRTKSGKITELAVRDVVHGRVVKNVEALANPEALAFYEGRVELIT
jgi:acetoacetyl-CoA synthetase|tara:strand:- start:123 stop:2075 length:1953 start_codon:yes stop_codon:yes gene_type:complete